METAGPTANKPRFERVLPRPPLPPGPYLVLGLARSGQAAAKLLAARGAEVIAADAGRPEGVDTLGDFGVEAHVDSDGVDLVERAKTVIKSPGVPSDAPAVVAARRAGREVIGELELGWRAIDNPVIAVTGTNGKTTTTSLVGAIFEQAGLPHALAGNIGTPLCALATDVEADATVICEVSSFQLDDAPQFTPECGVLLNVTEDHLDRYESFAAYRDSKLSMFSGQGPGQFAVIGPSVDVEIPGDGFKVRVSSDGFTNRNRAIALRGRHNIDNALAAAHAALLMGVDPAAVDATLSEFQGVAHRMEPVATVDGIEFINDSKATNVDAAVAALDSYDGGVRAILGGSLKGQGFAGLIPALEKAAVAAYLYGDAAENLREDLSASSVPLSVYPEFADAFAAAAKDAESGETVLLSPACASFDQHDDYEHRGDHFKELVAALKADS